MSECKSMHSSECYFVFLLINLLSCFVKKAPHYLSKQNLFWNWVCYHTRKVKGARPHIREAGPGFCVCHYAWKITYLWLGIVNSSIYFFVTQPHKCCNAVPGLVESRTKAFSQLVMFAYQLHGLLGAHYGEMNRKTSWLMDSGCLQRKPQLDLKLSQRTSTKL